MSQRLQVVISDEEMESLQRHAWEENLSIGEYVRRALREVESRRPVRSASEKLTAIREAARFSFAALGIEAMNREIERGYLD